ncbi:MAG: hypothetical protein IKT32_00815, partial [Clostridia bacterium]|nr:hypothetical protein [Clostridia bacterium]
FEGVVTRNYNQGVYVEGYDEETGMYYAMYVYYGYNFTGKGAEILSIGNKVKIVGNVQYWEAGGTYQVTDLQYKLRDPNHPNNIQKLGEGYDGAYLLTTADTFVNGKVKIETIVDGEETFVEHRYAALAMNTSISMENLYVSKVYTTTNEESSSKGAMTLTCTQNGVTIDIRTDVLRDENGNVITADQYLNKTINIRGYVDYYDGDYQVKVLMASDITILD